MTSYSRRHGYLENGGEGVSTLLHSLPRQAQLNGSDQRFEFTGRGNVDGVWKTPNQDISQIDTRDERGVNQIWDAQ